jgi:Mce-associated membrane protein
VEDQQTDTGDLTGAATPDASSSASAATPVGKRGRHRTFRPRRVTAQNEVVTPEITESSAAEPESTTVEESSPADADATTVQSSAPEPESAPSSASAAEAESAEAESTDVEDTDAKPAKRRRWFRARAAKPVADDDATTSAETAEPEPSEEADGEVKERKPVGRRLTVAVAAAAAIFVAAGAFGGAMLEPYIADRAATSTKIEIAKTAKDAITTLFTYTPDDMEKLPDRAARYLGGDLKESYAKQVDLLAATNKQSQIHRSAEVVGAAVESFKGDDATAMVYANISYTSAQTKDIPRIFLVAYRLTMQRKGGEWLITNMPWITSKDLTRI